MSLGIFLAAGRSLVGMRDNLSPYRMRTENLLPKFGSARNPFATTTEAGTPKPVAKAAAFIAPELPGLAPVPASADKVAAPSPVRPRANVVTARARLMPPPHRIAVAAAPPGMRTSSVSPAAIPAAVSAPVGPAGKPAAAPVPARGRFAAWLKKLNPLAPWRGRPSGPGRAVRRTGRRPEQTEFPLEQVQVMRNDLCDADIEVMPARPAPQAAFPAETDRTTWGRLTTRFFGAEQPLNR